MNTTHLRGLPLLNYIVDDVIPRNPKRWDQSIWAHNGSCGTTFCVAGWAVVLAGAAMLWTKCAEEEGCLVAMLCEDSEGFVREIPEYAQELLDLNDIEANYLFYCEGVIDELTISRDNIVQQRATSSNV